MSDRSLRPSKPFLTRRAFSRALVGSALGATALGSFAPGLSIANDAVATKTPASRRLLDDSPFVYISPLKKDGGESTCHGELWYAWIDDAVVVTVASDRWKATALSRGLDRARIWVGAHGTWKTWYGGTNEAFRGAPNFVARAERARDDALLERLLERYETKYPDEIADWREPMRKGNADGSRILLRYVPVS